MNGTRICSFPNCEGQVSAKALCNGHLHQQRRGVPLSPVRPTTKRDASLRDRLDMRTEKTGGCWLWTGAKQASGHGKLRDPRVGGAVLAHRLAFELEHGPIPEDAEVDHICRVPACVRPTHLQLSTKVTNGQNRRGANRNSKSGIRGVSWSQGAWLVSVWANRQHHYGGRFASIEDAERAAIALRNKVQSNNLLDRTT